MTFKIQEANGQGLPEYPQNVELADITVYNHDSGMICIHNHPCCICKINPSVLHTNTGIFQPCWNCQKKGYKITKKTESWFSKLFK